MELGRGRRCFEYCVLAGLARGVMRGGRKI